MNGYGIYQWPDRKNYEGEFKNDLRSDNGTMKWSGGKIYNGEWKGGKRHGNGMFTFYHKEKDRFFTKNSYWEEGIKVC